MHGLISFGADCIRGSGQIYKVSATGCAIASLSDVSPRPQLRVSMQLGGVAPAIIDTAIVRWIRQDKFGIEFLLADAAEAGRLGVCLAGLQGSDPGQS
jgi:hypothetical protein